MRKGSRKVRGEINDSLLSFKGLALLLLHKRTSDITLRRALYQTQ